MTHRFGVGQLVRPGERLLENTGIYETLRLPPSGPDEPLYRIKAATGPIQRAVRGGRHRAGVGLLAWDGVKGRRRRRIR